MRTGNVNLKGGIDHSRSIAHERECVQKQTTEEEKQRIEENLRKSHANNDRLKEEREKLLQEKDKLRRMAETEIEWLKEEIL